jgi:hypothetical protein
LIKGQLKRYIHAIPEFALFRFSVFRRGAVIALAAMGVLGVSWGMNYLAALKTYPYLARSIYAA